ncbi:MAG: hypothetical protein FWD66_00840 [Paludibacter sp.]|nr:hypothetical protein [Paludibacter sp.]
MQSIYAFVGVCQRHTPIMHGSYTHIRGATLQRFSDRALSHTVTNAKARSALCGER